MQNTWDILLDKLGIVKSFTDAAQNKKEYVADDKTLIKMINNLGYSLKNINESENLLQKIDNKRWQYALEPIYVVRLNQKSFDVILPATKIKKLDLRITCDEREIDAEYLIEIKEERKIGRTDYQRAELTITDDLEPAYYDIIITDGEHEYKSVLAVTPDKCFEPSLLKNNKIWGFAIQLYSLRSKRNWGIGDFTDLKNFTKMCQRQGADVIGINPLNVLLHDYPESASPYSSISRLFLNPIYIDVEAVEGFATKYIKGREKLIEELREKTDIDYTGVYNLKIDILKQIFADFIKTKPASFKDFEKYCHKEGEDLDNLAVFQAIYTDKCQKNISGWCHWPIDLQNPSSKAVADYKKEHSETVIFFKYLQYLAAKQFEEVYQSIKFNGLNIGLYRDLPVGLCKDSVELWAGNDLFIKNCGAGAPPDIFFPKGQKWCLGAFNPRILKEQAYRPFIKILRAAMVGAGALRLDHVMSLMRLYIIPDDSEEGTYVYYNFEDMLGILALESHLHKCMIVGESIGNVPAGFIDKIHERGIYSLSVLWAERWCGCGDFKMPQDYEKNTFSSVGTHDMAPLKMRWFGYDIEELYRLKMISETERQEQYHGREDERRRLLHALDCAGVWPTDKLRQSDCIYGEGYPYGITEAVEKFVSSSSSAVYLAQLEDFFGVEVLQNLPGTNREQHPNWRRKIPINLEDYEENADFISARKAIVR